MTQPSQQSQPVSSVFNGGTPLALTKTLSPFLKSFATRFNHFSGSFSQISSLLSIKDMEGFFVAQHMFNAMVEQNLGWAIVLGSREEFRVPNMTKSPSLLCDMESIMAQGEDLVTDILPNQCRQLETIIHKNTALMEVVQGRPDLSALATRFGTSTMKLVDQYGRVKLSSIMHRVASSQVTITAQGYDISCSILGTQHQKGDLMGILYDANQVSDVESFLCYSTNPIHLVEHDAASFMAAHGGRHPVTGKPVNAVITVQCDSLQSKLPEEGPVAMMELIRFLSQLQGAMRLYQRHNYKILRVLTPLVQQLGQCITWDLGTDANPKTWLHIMEKALLSLKTAMECGQKNITTSVGMPKDIQDRMQFIMGFPQNIAMFYKELPVLLIQESLHDIANQCIEMRNRLSADGMESSWQDIRLEVVDTLGDVLALLQKLEMELCILVKRLNRVRKTHKPVHIKASIIKGCEFRIARIHEKMRSLQR